MIVNGAVWRVLPLRDPASVLAAGRLYSRRLRRPAAPGGRGDPRSASPATPGRRR